MGGGDGSELDDTGSAALGQSSACCASRAQRGAMLPPANLAADLDGDGGDGSEVPELDDTEHAPGRPNASRAQRGAMLVGGAGEAAAESAAAVVGSEPPLAVGEAGAAAPGAGGGHGRRRRRRVYQPMPESDTTSVTSSHAARRRRHHHTLREPLGALPSRQAAPHDAALLPFMMDSPRNSMRGESAATVAAAAAAAARAAAAAVGLARVSGVPADASTAADRTRFAARLALLTSKHEAACLVRQPVLPDKGYASGRNERPPRRQRMPDAPRSVAGAIFMSAASRAASSPAVLGAYHSAPWASAPALSAEQLPTTLHEEATGEEAHPRRGSDDKYDDCDQNGWPMKSTGAPDPGRRPWVLPPAADPLPADPLHRSMTAPPAGLTPTPPAAAAAVPPAATVVPRAATSPPTATLPPTAASPPARLPPTPPSPEATLIRKGALDDVLWPVMEHRGRRRRRPRTLEERGKGESVESSEQTVADPRQAMRRASWHVEWNIAVADALMSLSQADCVQLVRDATMLPAEVEAASAAAVPPPAAAPAAAEDMVREARGMLHEQARVGGLRSVLNIFMSALMDSDAHHDAACAAMQRAVLHGMAFAASTEEGAAAFNVGVLETVFGLAYSADAGVRLQATQLLLKLATAANAGIGAADGVLRFFWSLEGLHGIFTLLSSNLGSEQQTTLTCWLQLLLSLLQANGGAADRERLCTIRLFSAQLDRIEQAMRTRTHDSFLTPATADSGAQQIGRLLEQIRPLLVAHEEASSAPAPTAPSERSPTNPQRWVAQQRAALAAKMRGSMWPKSASWAPNLTWTEVSSGSGVCP